MATAILLEVQYFATVQYFSKLLHYPQVYIEQQENYRKGSFRNRCCIATANGILALSVPLQKGKHQQANIQQVKIDNSTNWQLEHWRSLATAYGKSPYFEYYKDELEVFYTTPFEYLSDCCWAAQELILELLQFSPTISPTTRFEKSPADSSTLDFRNQILPKNYQNQVDPNFKIVPYPQLFTDRLGFLPNLSILDLLFCTGPESLIYLDRSFIK